MIFNIISLFGGLALFLYGMRLMSGTLKESSSGTLKNVLEKVTNSPLKAFALGILVTAIIQSSTATIVITSGLVAAGLITLDQSLGIIIGSNVGTTVTGQIIRLLDIDAGSNSLLKFFQPSTLAPVALTVGIVLIMFFKFSRHDVAGNILMGFGILFSGLMNMTAAVDTFTESGVLDRLFAGLGQNPLLAYLTGAGVAFVLQSSSATIGILQAFSMAGTIPFGTVFIVIVGIYLGDCLTTGIVCSIGSKADARRVGLVNILFNLSETVLVLIVVNVIHALGLIDGLWGMEMSPGSIANTNSVFNLSCAVLLLPMVKVYGRLSRRLIKDEPVPVFKYADKIDALNPVFFSTPALAFRSCYNLLIATFDDAADIIGRAFDVISCYDADAVRYIEQEEDNIDRLTDAVSAYMVQLSPYVREEYHVRILDQYYKVITEFERLGDHAMNMAEIASEMHEDGIVFSEQAQKELSVMRELLSRTLDYTRTAFVKRNEPAARHIEPLEQVMDDMVNSLHDAHLDRLREGSCTIHAGTCFMDVLTNIERVSDICSNVGVATIARIHKDSDSLAHNYISALHQGKDADFNNEYNRMHDEYFGRLKMIAGDE